MTFAGRLLHIPNKNGSVLIKEAASPTVVALVHLAPKAPPDEGGRLRQEAGVEQDRGGTGVASEVHQSGPRREEPSPRRCADASEGSDDYLKRHCEAEGLNLDGLRHRLGVIKKRFGAMSLSALELPGAVEDFKADLVSKGLAPASVNRYLAQLRHMFNWAIDRELMERTPFRGRGRGVRMLRENNHRYRRLTADEEKRLLEAAKNDPLMNARIIAALDTGMRRGEMLLLQNKHVLWKEDLIRIVGANAKSRKERRIPISTSRRRSVLEKRAFLGPRAYVFGNECGGRQVDSRDAWRRILAAAKITDKKERLDGDLRWHDLRHECGSRLAERGVPLHEIQHLLGHASLATTQRYLNSTVESLKKSVKVLEPKAV